MTGALKRMLVVVPVKDFSQAKSRLGPELKPSDRAAVAAVLFTQTIDFLKNHQEQSETPFDIAVVTGCFEVVQMIEDQTVHLIYDCQRGGLNDALHLAADWATAHDYDSLCVLPADIAAPQFEEFEWLLSMACSGQSLVLCPAHDYGTNVLIVSPPDAITFAYGTDSFANHQAQALEHGLDCIIAPAPSFSKDVDCMEDLAEVDPKLLPKSLSRRVV